MKMKPEADHQENNIKEFNLHTIVRLPKGVFSPYTGINTNILFFDKGEPTKVLPELLSPLPQCTEPNQRIHADLFGPLKTTSGDKKFILCLTDAFTKYVELVTIKNVF